MSYRIRQAIAAYLLAFFINLALATSNGVGSSEAARLWARRPAVVLAYDPDDISGELSLPDDDDDDLSWLTDDNQGEDWSGDEATDEDIDLGLLANLVTAADLPPDPALDPDGYTAWFIAKMPPKQARMWRLLPDTIELPTDVEALRWRYN
ncbi:MAG: hypothetical protein DLM69_06035 [Candidatus Chloroheliales bacterium]|nr:MAG: hypothetical protein DLM69_06035 [Chloroflexota bacterium]